MLDFLFSITYVSLLFNLKENCFSINVFMYKLKIARSYNKICYFRKTSLFSSRKENFLGLPFLSRNLIEAKNTRFPLSLIILGSIFYFHNYGAFSLSCLTRKRGAFCISTKHCFQFGKFSKVLESHCAFMSRPSENSLVEFCISAFLPHLISI